MPLLVTLACATGGELPEEGAPLTATPEAGTPSGSIRVEAGTTTMSEEAGAPKEGGTPADASTQADTAPPPPPPPTTPVCDPNKSSYGLLVLALVIAGSPPNACSAGACGSGECCYNSQYCLPE